MQNINDTETITADILYAALHKLNITDLRVAALDTVGSTNTLAKEMAGDGIPTLIVANGQTGGRGRLGRSFACPDGAGVYMSLLIYPDMPAAEVSRLTCLAAVAAARAVTAVSGITPFIKWVNDLYIGGKKLAGILTEGSINQDGSLAYAVIGIGINVHPADRGEYSDIATDIDTEGGKPTSRADLIAKLVAELLPMIEADPTPFFEEYIDRASPIIGRRVLVKRGECEFYATVDGFEPDCRIRVKSDSGEITAIGSGEVAISFKM